MLCETDLQGRHRTAVNLDLVELMKADGTGTRLFFPGSEDGLFVRESTADILEKVSSNASGPVVGRIMRHPQAHEDQPWFWTRGYAASREQAMRYFKARYGKGLFIIRNGQKVAKYEAGKWVPLLSGVVVRDTPDGIKIEMPH